MINKIKKNYTLYKVVIIRWFLALLNKTLFKYSKKDEYLEYLKKNIKGDWKVHSLNQYYCYRIDCFENYTPKYYIRLESESAVCIRNANVLHLQTASGPFCEWFTVSKGNVHLYLL
jgi:hypothetical protein